MKIDMLNWFDTLSNTSFPRILKWQITKQKVTLIQSYHLYHQATDISPTIQHALAAYRSELIILRSDIQCFL